MICREKKIREELVEIYDIKPVAHVKLLDGQEKKSCTGDKLTNSYYCFSYRKKNKSEKNFNSFYCGTYASKHFLELLELEPLTCFNPLKNNSRSGGLGHGGSNLNNPKKWDPTMKELHDALNLLIIYWDISPKGAILNLKLQIEQYKYAKPFDSLIKSVNTIISKDINKYNMTQIIDSLNEIDDIKNYNFERVRKRLEDLKIKSYF